MSNLNTEKEYSSIKEMLDFVLDENKKTIYISIPAIVKGYNAMTKRAVVVPAIEITYEDGSSAEIPPINDVPVIFPSGGGYTISMPVTSGDTVLLCFSHRSLEQFKESFEMSKPNPQIMQLHDCVAIAGFGALVITPSGNGASMQSNDGVKAVTVDDNGITLKKGGNRLNLSSGAMTATINGATLALTESSLICSVPIDAPGFGSAGGAAQMSSGLNSPSIKSNGVDITGHYHSDPHGGVTGPPQS